jgi:HJR/Mrr/RecB family endonuclease
MKQIALNHKFTYRATDFCKKQLASSGSLKNLTKIIKDQSNTMNPDRYDPLKYCGDAFEWFAEFFFKYFDGDNLFLNVTEYSPTKASGDYGVDGVAKYVKDLLKIVCLQHKYKSNCSVKLSSEKDKLGNFGANAKLEYNADYLIVFTNASGITHTTSEGIFAGNLMCINGEIISRYVDNNAAFWNDFLEIVSKVST